MLDRRHRRRRRGAHVDDHDVRRGAERGRLVDDPHGHRARAQTTSDFLCEIRVFGDDQSVQLRHSSTEVKKPNSETETTAPSYGAVDMTISSANASGYRADGRLASSACAVAASSAACLSAFALSLAVCASRLACSRASLSATF